MDVLAAYRKIPAPPAGGLAGLFAGCIALGCTALGVATIGFVLEKFGGPSGMGEGILVVAKPNMAVPVFVSAFCILIRCHHPITWKAPTVAFVLCAVSTWAWTRFGLAFAPAVLGTGGIAWLVRELLLVKKETTGPRHVL
jgi:hypothetical protein